MLLLQGRCILLNIVVIIMIIVDHQGDWSIFPSHHHHRHCHYHHLHPHHHRCQHHHHHDHRHHHFNLYHLVSAPAHYREKPTSNLANHLISTFIILIIVVTIFVIIIITTISTLMRAAPDAVDERWGRHISAVGSSPPGCT